MAGMDMLQLTSPQIVKEGLERLLKRHARTVQIWSNAPGPAGAEEKMRKRVLKWVASKCGDKAGHPSRVLEQVAELLY